MDTTTLQNFWYDGAVSTTEDVIFGNWPFFAIVFIILLGIMLLGGLVIVIKKSIKKL